MSGLWPQGQVRAQRLDEFLHRGGQHAALAVQDGERAGELLALKGRWRAYPAVSLPVHGGLRDDGDAVVDFDRALHGLDVVELHDRL